MEKEYSRKIESAESRNMTRIKETHEKIDIVKTLLTKEIEAKVEQEKKHRNEQFTETYKLIESNKNLINEHVR